MQNPLFIRCHPSSTICIFLITNHQPLFQFRYELQLPFSFLQPHSVHSPPGSPHPAHITTSQSRTSLSPSVTPSTFHSRLKTHLFSKSNPPYSNQCCGQDSRCRDRGQGRGSIPRDRPEVKGSWSIFLAILPFPNQ